MTDRDPRRAAKAKAAAGPDPKAVLAGLAVGAGILIAAGQAAFGESHSEIIESHGFSSFADTPLKYGPDFEHFDYVNPDAPKGGEISIATVGTFDSFNPYSREGRAGALSSLPYETIMEYSADDVAGPYCLLCTGLRTNANQDFVEFDLNPDARFADGEPLTADDVVFTVNLFLEQGLPSFRFAVAERITSVEAIDEHTVRFEFNPDVARKALVTQAGGFPVFPQHWFEENGARLDESRLESAPGSGPYQLASYDVNRQIVYERNPDWWGADLPINRGRHNFDRIRVEYFGDDVAAMEGFRAGVYTFREESSSLQWATAYDFDAVDEEYVVLEELADGNIPSSSGFVFNLGREKFQDPRVREAIGLMFNFGWTNETLQYGLFDQRHSFWQGSDLEAAGPPERRELELLQEVAGDLDPAILTDDPVMAHDSGERRLDRGNLRRAAALLADAGYEAGPDGFLQRDGETLTLEFLASSSSSNIERVITPFLENLRALGVDAEYVAVDPAQFTNRRRDRDYDMLLGSYANGPIEGTGIGQRYGSDDAEVSVFNPAGYSSPAVDVLIERVAEASSMEEMAAAVRAVDRILRAERFVVPVWYKANYWVAYWDQYDHPDELPPYDLGELDFWWYDAEAAAELRAAGALR
ncbi:MAG: extracellular solute-binding protein [Hasllibacter sp.]